ncbi:hypothetical protein ACQ4PT_057575 [Festuca glaucescens]
MANSVALSLLTVSLLLCVAPLLPSTAQEPSIAPRPAFAFGWLGDRSAFRAGDTAVIVIMSFDLPDANVSAVRRSGSFTLTVRGKTGNSTYVADVSARLEGAPPSWNITFVPLRAGDFVAVLEEERFAVGVSTLYYTVAARDVHPSASLASWMYFSGYVVAGSKAFVSVTPRDAFGNDVPRGADGMPGDGYFRVSGSYLNGTAVEFLDFQYNGWTGDGRLSLEFVPTLAGDFLVQVYGDNNMTLRDSPLLLTVKPGPIDIAKSTADWKHGTNVLQIFSKLEIFINQKDSYGNLVPEIHPFDAAVVEKASNLSVPVGDLRIEAVAEGIQLLSFNVGEPGEFVLTIFDLQLKQKLSNIAYIYNVFVGYSDGSNSFANGSGITQSVAGSVSSFMVFLEDQYRDPSPVETAMLQVQILSRNGTSVVNPIISPRHYTWMDRILQIMDLLMVAGNSTLQASHFNVSYTPEIAGEYDIWVLCGNIVLNNGNPYAMTVSPGAVSTSIPSDPLFEPRVKRSVRNEVTVRLRDLFMNPVVSLEPKLRLQLTSANIPTLVNTSSFAAEEFVDNKDGSYTTHYVAKYLGSYSLCTQLNNTQLPPCPFEVHVLGDDYFSEVQNDNISVWEDESVSFDVLSNDYIAAGQPEGVYLSSVCLLRNKSHLLLVLSLEVLEGTLVMTLPAGIVATAELKADGNNHWQSLQAYVAIAHHFVLRGTGIRFHGNVSDCNNAMQRLFYQGASHETRLFITVNDLGNYGCYPDCSEMMSTPLSTAKTVRLVKTKPMNSRRAILVGSAIAIEILAMLCLGGVLLYFLVKCMSQLKGKQRDRVNNEVRKAEQTPSRQMAVEFSGYLQKQTEAAFNTSSSYRDI